MSWFVGLTGGIGSGKSTAARQFAALGADIVDTDIIAHQLTAPDGAAIPAIRTTFGADFLTPDGALNRARMRETIFADPAAKQKLEAILHPAIRSEAQRQAGASTAPYVLVVVPLLFESGAYRNWLHRVCAVDCPEDLQIARTMQRSGLSETAVRAIMAQQLSRAERCALADDTVDNSGTTDALHDQVTRLHALYLDLAAKNR
ncbi:MAG: dephospho-CoA kinase [Pseudomonadota bacterium]